MALMTVISQRGLQAASSFGDHWAIDSSLLFGRRSGLMRRRVSPPRSDLAERGGHAPEGSTMRPPRPQQSPFFAVTILLHCEAGCVLVAAFHP